MLTTKAVALVLVGVAIGTAGCLLCQTLWPRRQPPNFVTHVLPVPSTALYRATGPLMIMADCFDGGSIKSSADGKTFTDVPCINHTFGDDYHWTEVKVRDSLVWIRVEGDGKTTETKVRLITGEWPESE